MLVGASTLRAPDALGDTDEPLRIARAWPDSANDRRPEVPSPPSSPPSVQRRSARGRWLFAGTGLVALLVAFAPARPTPEAVAEAVVEPTVVEEASVGPVVHAEPSAPAPAPERVPPKLAPTRRVEPRSVAAVVEPKPTPVVEPVPQPLERAQVVAPVVVSEPGPAIPRVGCLVFQSTPPGADVLLDGVTTGVMAGLGERASRERPPGSVTVSMQALGRSAAVDLVIEAGERSVVRCDLAGAHGCVVTRAEGGCS